jgi:hypothetical protein
LDHPEPSLVIRKRGVGQIGGRDNDLLSKTIVHDTEKMGRLGRPIRPFSSREFG